MDRESDLEKALDRVEVLEEAYETACIDYASAESEYRVQYAKEFLAADGTEKARQAKAIVAVDKYLRERDRTEAARDFTRAKLKDAQDAVSARQSLLSSSRRTSEAFG